jgi:hypothetical protein
MLQHNSPFFRTIVMQKHNLQRILQFSCYNIILGAEKNLGTKGHFIEENIGAAPCPAFLFTTVEEFDFGILRSKGTLKDELLH